MTGLKSFINQKRLTFSKFFQSAHSAIRFYRNKGNCRVVLFRVPSEIMFSYLDYDIVKTISDRIEDIANSDLVELDKEFVTLDKGGERFYKLRKILKICWLIEDIKNNGVKNPFQLLKNGDNKYFVHPGTDRIIVTTYITPNEYVEGFYLWYPDLDAHPFVLDYEHKFINSWFGFIRLFKYNETFRIRDITISDTLDVSDRLEGDAVFATAKNCFSNIKEKYRYQFITFFDKIQWKKIEGKVRFQDYVKFISDKECFLSGVRFVKKDNLWIQND
jgi:hypothetical protein